MNSLHSTKILKLHSKLIWSKLWVYLLYLKKLNLLNGKTISNLINHITDPISSKWKMNSQSLKYNYLINMITPSMNGLDGHLHYTLQTQKSYMPEEYNYVKRIFGNIPCVLHLMLYLLINKVYLWIVQNQDGMI